MQFCSKYIKSNNTGNMFTFRILLQFSIIICTFTAHNTDEHSSKTTTDVINELTRRVDDLEKKLEQKLGETTNELNVFRERCQCQAKTSRSEDPSTVRDKRQAPTVAFTTYLDHNLTHLGIDHTLIYDRVLLNEGGAYNSNTGVFTCPYNGIYSFHFTVSTDGIEQIVAKLVVDGVNQVDGISDTYHAYHEAQGGNHAILSLQRGQSVWISNYRWADKGVYSNGRSRFSTFSGYLVFYK